MKFKKSEVYFTIQFQFSLNHHKIYQPYCLHELIINTNILSRMEPQACSVHDFLITSGICAFTLGFRAFTRDFHALLVSFTLLLVSFTLLLVSFTLLLVNFTLLLVNSAYRLTFFLTLQFFRKKRTKPVSFVPVLVSRGFFRPAIL
jgi:hypothetical protein